MAKFVFAGTTMTPRQRNRLILDTAVSGVLLTWLIWGKRGLYVLAGLIALFVTWALLVVTDVIGPGSRPLTAQQCAAARGVGLPHVDQNHPECRLR